MKSSDDPDLRGVHVKGALDNGDEGLRTRLADLSYPAPVWMLVAHAHSWGADAGSVDRLSRLPIKDYQGVDDVLHALGQKPGPPPSTGLEQATRPGGPDTEVDSAPETGTAGFPPGRRSPVEHDPGPKRHPALAAANGLNKAGQHRIVGEGLAVGLLALGMEAMSINQQLVESAFAQAWLNWAPSSGFPQLRADAHRNDIVAILRSSARRKGPQIADWSTEGEYGPKLCVSSTIDDALLAVGKKSGVAHHQWLELARGFVAQLREDAGEIRFSG